MFDFKLKNWTSRYNEERKFVIKYKRYDDLVFFIVAEWLTFDLSIAAWSESGEKGRVMTGYERDYIPQQRNINSLISTTQLRCFGNLKTLEWEANTHKIPSRKQSCQDVSESLFIIDLVYKIWILFITELLSLILSS